MNGGHEFRKNQTSVLMLISFTEINPALINRFHYAAYGGDVRGALQFLDNGVPIDSRGEIGSTALHGAAISKQIDVVRLLLQKGADVNKQNDLGWTPLHGASLVNSTNVIRLLLDQGASTNIENNFGEKPIHWARQKYNKEAVHLLKKYLSKCFLRLQSCKIQHLFSFKVWFTE